MEAGPAADVEHIAARPIRDRAHGRLDQSVTIDGVVLQLVDGWVVPDVRASPNSQSRTSPLGVWNETATMPGVPFGATQSTFTSSSGCSTGAPSHSVTRAGSPAISSASSEMLPVAPVDGC